ncbi:hypothetical protein A7E75_00420 [Syntrophotalea acetylenica]|uniref:Uncharacterized protein n=1 Tax=Syntrophotalea acetylenica TaxID=29542 RepID=A0A1L3GCH9_SYNAC|nr:hypothetical protein A7E75_00420 [Syntrophotalea acetylenica]APG44232.1 hypothetical protein A6070_09025 [Syntrophotalea acetylenica]
MLAVSQRLLSPILIHSKGQPHVARGNILIFHGKSQHIGYLMKVRLQKKPAPIQEVFPVSMRVSLSPPEAEVEMSA